MPALQRVSQGFSKSLFLLAPAVLLLFGWVLLAPTAQGAAPAAEVNPPAQRPPGWSDETHGNDVAPNYAVVFPADKVNQLTITVTPENWEAMLADMTELYGEQGSRTAGRMGAPPAPGGNAAPPDALAAGAPGRPAGQPPGGFGGPGGMGGSFTTTNPIWVTGAIEFAGDVWTNVGVRFKGNSSLMSAWSSGSLKLPFKLDFDQFEDLYPEIKNQRFYGFKQLSLGNNFSDNAMLRDALAYDVYEAAGLVAAETGFYQVFLDYGEGPVDLGLYTVVEVIDDTVVARAFGGDAGNIYEGDGRAVTLAAGTAEAQIEESFQKENNDAAADWSDIAGLYDALHAETRTTDPEAWRAELEEVFDVDTFLKWLAVSAQIGHWDTYGAMTHNFYLYHDPATGQLTWITWDHNMTFSGGMGDPGGAGGMLPGGFGGAPPAGAARPSGGITVTQGMTAAQGVAATASVTAAQRLTATQDARPAANAARLNRGGPGRGVSLDKSDVGDDWPLIRFLLDDPVYYARYVDSLAETSAILDPAAMTARVETYAAVLAPYAEAEIGPDAYTAAVQGVIDYITTRAEEVQTFLAAQP